MTSQSTSLSLDRKDKFQLTNLVQRLGSFVVFLVCGVAIFVVGSNYFTIFPTNRNLAYNVILSAVFFAASMWLKRDERLGKYWRVAFAFFSGSFAFLLTLLFSSGSSTVLGWFNLTVTTSPGIAIAKVYEMVLIIVPIIALNKLSGANLGSIYLQRGDLKRGLGIGMLVFFNLATSAFLYFAGRYTGMDSLMAAVAWGVVFSFANSFMEELWLRGIFLKRFEPSLGASGSILLTSILFSLMHVGAVYVTPAAMPIMLVYALTLGLGCGFLMMKTGSIWGAVLIHAAADFFLLISLFANT